jgi:rhodanese-related sulfurtransferase
METAMRCLSFPFTVSICLAILCGMTNGQVPSKTGAPVDLPVMQNNLFSHGVNTLDCGLHALYAASILVDNEIPFEFLFGDLSIKMSRQGISDSELIRIAEKHGLVAEKISGLSSADLSSTSCPLLLPLRMDRRSQNLHWVTLCGVESDGFVFFDSIDAQLKLTGCEVDSLWDGQGILIGKSRKIVDDSQNLLWLSGFSRKVLFLSVVLTFVLATNNVRWTRRWKSIVLVSSCMLMYFFFEASLYNRDYYNLMRLSNCWNEQSSPDRFVREVPTNPETLIVDCRQSADFGRGHIPGAVNLPINASAITWNRFVTAHHEQDILVYCQSVHCGWAEQFQKRCNCLGIKASVLSGGYERFKAHN